MNLNINKGSIPTVVNLPSSKSYANRALILGALKRNKTIFKNLPLASDVTNLIDALEVIGLDIKFWDGQLSINNSFPECEETNKSSLLVEVGEGGTTARFLACMLLKGTNPYILKLGTRLKERPWEEFISFVNAHGAQCSLRDDELFLQGPVELPSKIEVDCSRTTQYATGLALAFSDSTQVIPTNLKTSQSYWEMSLKLIEEFRGISEYITPIDWSSASYPLAFAALNQETFFPRLKEDNYQADAKFFNLLNSLGMITVKNDGVLITPKKQSRNIELDVSDCLDLVPTLVYFLSYLEGEHSLEGVGNLVHKESDRLAESIRILEAFKISYKVVDEKLVIHGEDKRLDESVSIDLPDDHRMVMSAVLFMRHNAGGTVSPWQAVNKSYPDFFKLFD